MVSDIDSSAYSGGSIPPVVVNAPPPPTTAHAATGSTGTGSGRCASLFFHSHTPPQPPYTGHKKTHHRPLRQRAPLARLEARQRGEGGAFAAAGHLQGIFSSAVLPCAQRESNRRLHGTSPVIQPLGWHTPQPHTTPCTHTNTATPHDVRPKAAGECVRTTDHDGPLGVCVCV